MERNKTKIKYILGIWKNLEGYPTKEDVIYEIKNYLVKEGKPNSEFSHQNLKSVFGLSWEKSKSFEVFEQLLAEGEITETDSNKKKYKIMP
jgi:hypothetical protein